MLDYTASQIISEFLDSQNEVFTVDDVIRYLKSKGKRCNKDEINDLLHTSNFIFPLINGEFITRAGVFTGRWFSFKPSKEEVEKNHILIGHRCIPFLNQEISPDSVQIVASDKIIRSDATVFSMNLAMDTFALFGEGYVIPYIFNDKGNDEIPLTTVQYNIPKEIKLTSWPLDKIAGNQTFEFGDRLLCRVLNWNEGMVEMYVLKNEMNNMVISNAVIEREEWYTHFEDGLLKSFKRNGPCDSIEEQLALLFLEGQEDLCIRNCGSAEEFLKHTKKIGFSQFGVESRIWYNGESVPYVGEWNKSVAKDLILSDMSVSFTPKIIDAYLENYLYEESKGKSKDTLDDLSRIIFPISLKMSSAERKTVLLNIEKRHDILKRQYNKFSDYTVAPVRKRILKLFTQVNELLCAIGCSGLDVSDFPQQELVVLTQLFSHIVRLLEEVENVFLRDQLPLGDISLSLEGMDDTFEDIRGTLKSSLDYNMHKGFNIVGDIKNGK